MVGWLYIDEQVAAPVRVLEIDERTGLLSIEVAGKFVPNRAALRGQTVLEYRGWKRRRLVRCLGAEEAGSALLIEAVDLGRLDPDEELDPPMGAGQGGAAEDWLAVDSRAVCRVSGTRVGACPGSVVTHCLFHVPLDDWRDLRIGEGAVLAGLGVRHADAEVSDGSITPLLHSARDLPPGHRPPRVELIRLRERLRYHIHPMATDWGESTTLVVSRVIQSAGLGDRSPNRLSVTA